MKKLLGIVSNLGFTARLFLIAIAVGMLAYGIYRIPGGTAPAAFIGMVSIGLFASCPFALFHKN